MSRGFHRDLLPHPEGDILEWMSRGSINRPPTGPYVPFFHLGARTRARRERERERKRASGNYARWYCERWIFLDLSARVVKRVMGRCRAPLWKFGYIDYGKALTGLSRCRDHVDFADQSRVPPRYLHEARSQSSLARERWLCWLCGSVCCKFYTPTSAAL